MSKSQRHNLPPEEQRVLEHGHIRLLVSPKDMARCDQAIVEHHYLHSVSLVGEHLRYAFIYKGQWLAVATWSAAAFHIKERDQFIGWSEEQCRRRRALVANDSRLLVMPGCHYPNLISSGFANWSRDGKKVRHAGVEIVNAANSKGRFLGSVVTQSKSNEIPAARQLLDGQSMEGKILVADAMHTQDETARKILFEGGGDHLLTVKGNQSTLETTLQKLSGPPAQQLHLGRTASRRDAVHQARLLGCGKPFAPFPGHHLAGGPEPSAHSRSRTGAGNHSTRDCQPGQRGCESGAEMQSQEQV